MNSPNRTARVAGVLYLLLALLSGIPFFYITNTIVESGDAGATADNIVANATMFRLAFVSDMLGMTCYVLVAMALYLLFKHVNKNAAAAMVVFAAIGAAIMGLNGLNHFAALMIATDGSFATTFGADGSDALVLTFLDLRGYGYLIAQVFFGLWLLPMGYLVYKSELLPKALGVLLVIGCFGYLVDLMVKFLFADIAPTISPIVIIPATVAEVWMIGYLLVKGIRTQQAAHLPAAA